MAEKQTKRRASRLILINEAAGFFVVLLLICLDEILDFPALLFGMEATPVNWSEMILESLGVIILAVWVIGMTARHLKRLEYLEGFLSMCASCKKIRVDDTWVPLEKFISERSDAVFSHGLCPDCCELFFNNRGDSEDSEVHPESATP